MVQLDCYHNNRESIILITLFVRTIELEALIAKDSMKDYQPKYNITNSISKKRHNSTALVSMAIPITHQSWWIAAIVVVSCLLLLLIVYLICIFVKRKGKIVEGEELSSIAEDIFQRNIHDISPISHGRNTYSASPKKSYSPIKQPICSTKFSFSSPKKYDNEIIYPSTKSVVEMSPPYRVQPQLDTLYPPMRGSPNLSLVSTGDERQRTLLQSRRGSSASLIIDISPKNMVYSFCLHDSPTEEILKHKSRLLTYVELDWLKDHSDALYEEFWTIPPNTVSRKDSQMRFSLKNRYPDIIPNPRSMVRFNAADQTPVYINANFITGMSGYADEDEYIATQGPLPCTIDDFWLMIWTFNCSIIVMITKLREKHKEKCVQYWPSNGKVNQERYGDFVVTNDTEIKRDGYSITTLYISHKGCEESRKITHFWFTVWPDHKVPNETLRILSFMKEVQEARVTNSSPVVVHCSAGRGRTGCFIALSMGISQIDSEDMVDILRIVSHMRIYRGGLVDKVQQYVFLHKALHDYWSDKLCLPVPLPASQEIYLETEE